MPWCSNLCPNLYHVYIGFTGRFNLNIVLSSFKDSSMQQKSRSEGRFLGRTNKKIAYFETSVVEWGYTETLVWYLFVSSRTRFVHLLFHLFFVDPYSDETLCLVKFITFDSLLSLLLVYICLLKNHIKISGYYSV